MYCKRPKLGLMASLVLAITVSAPVSAQVDNQQAVVNLVVQVQQLQDEVRMLRGMLEEQAMELENLGNRQRDQYLDLDQRITGLRSASPGPMVGTPETNSAATYGTRGQAEPE